MRSFGTSLTPPGPPSPNVWVLGRLWPSQKNGPEMGFLGNRDFQKYRVGVELEAETFTNRLSVQSYVGNAPHVFGLIFRLDEVMIRKHEF